MKRKPRIVILNGTCLRVADQYRGWLEGLAVEVIADPSHAELQADQMDDVLAGVHGVVLPGAAPLLPQHMGSHVELQAISLASSGYEYVDIEAATRYGIAVTNAPIRQGAEVVADLTWGLMLAVARQIPYHHHLLRDGRFERGIGSAVWRKTLGIVGLGNIGKAVARRARGFDMTVLATEIEPDAEFVRQYAIELVPLDDLLRRSDVVSLHLRINAETKHIINAERLALMKPTAYLINAARQELVDEAALTAAIQTGGIAGAALDDPPGQKDSPLLTRPNVVCTPHLGNMAIEGVRAVFERAVENAVAVVTGRRCEYVLNPEVYAGAPRAPQPTD